MSASQDRPLLWSLSETFVNYSWSVFGIGALVAAWCVLDSWNHETISGIYKQTEVTDEYMNPFTGEMVAALEPFSYTLTLAFLQFAFMGLAFVLIFAASTLTNGKSVGSNLSHLRSTVSDGRWPALVGTHMFGSLLLQSLMMPTSMMSLGVFAATRAVEIPVTAGVRAKVFRSWCGGHAPVAIGLMFAAAWLLFFSYSQIAECLCVWSGFGVALTGAPLYVVYALLLTIPACNMVFQESVLVQLKVDPFLMQGIQNICAALLFAPILFGAHLLGYEDVQHGARMIMAHREVYMAVLWLCMQSTILSFVTVGLISMVDSFWAVAARSLRVVFWWLRQLPMFYLTSSTLLSVAHPHASLWSFGMICGIVLGLCAVVTDRRPTEASLKGKEHEVPAEHTSLAKGLGMGDRKSVV